MKLPKILLTISTTLAKKNAKAIVVGGSVRDHFLNLPYKDYDVEIYGLDTIEALEKILVQHGSVNLVGKSFGVLKFTHNLDEYDFSFPRSERKVAKGHTGFEVIVDGNLDFKSAAKRRDFTLNAMGYDIENNTFIDPFNGLKDIENKTLKYIDDTTFIEDPLRVYRAVQFSARFGFGLDDDTYNLCKKMTKDGLLEELPKERIYTEFTKLLLKSPKPSLGFELMRGLGILDYFPELKALINVPQSPIWHPEGDVWIHTMMCIDAMVGILSKNEKQNLKFMFAILCHDFGKATHTTIEEDGCIRAIGHEQAGIEPTKSFMYRISDEHDFIQSLLPLVEHHLKPSQFHAAKSKATAIRRLATKVNIEELIIVAKADFLGRTTKESLEGIYYAGEWLLEQAKALRVNEKPLEHLLQGRDLIALGLKPSPRFKEILNWSYALQLEGKIYSKEEALNNVKDSFVNTV